MRSLRIEEAVSLQWEVDLSYAQRLLLACVAGLHPSSADRHWTKLRGHERDAITRAAVAVLELAELISGDLSG